MTQRRHELTDFEWSIIAPLLPNKPRGVARVDDQKVLNGIYRRLRTGSPWGATAVSPTQKGSAVFRINARPDAKRRMVMLAAKCKGPTTSTNCECSRYPFLNDS